MITVARIHYIYTNIWISVNGFILYVVGAGVPPFAHKASEGKQGYSIADWRILISHGHTRTDTDDLIDKIYPQITQIRYKKSAHGHGILSKLITQIKKCRRKG
jgi:hypothetical protein